jgi:hypothetical protein
MSGMKGGRAGPAASGPISAQKPTEAEGPEEGPEEITELSISVSPRGKAVVEKILKGRLGDFIPEQKIKNPQYVNREAIQIYFRTEDGRRFRETFTLSTAANSKLRRFITKYGPPKVGMEIEYQEDARGFPRVVL